MKYTTTMLERGSIESNKITAAVKTLDTLLKWSGRYDNKLSVFAAIDIGMLGAMFIAIHPLISLILETCFAESAANLPGHCGDKRAKALPIWR